MDGSHSPGGRTVTASRNSSKPTMYNVVFIQTKLKGVGTILELWEVYRQMNYLDLIETLVFKWNQREKVVQVIKSTQFNYMVSHETWKFFWFLLKKLKSKRQISKTIFKPLLHCHASWDTLYFSLFSKLCSGLLYRVSQ